MRARLLTLLLLVGVTAGCHDTRGSEALLALVKLHPEQPANCVALEVLTPEGVSLHSERVPRSRDKLELRVALYREQLPEQVDIQAHALWSTGCTDPQQSARPNGSSARVRARFVAKPGTVEVPLGLPEQDADSDGFADGQAGGADCQDDRSDRNPAATEVCDALEDRNCDALRGCDDPACSLPGCIPVPSKLAFTVWVSEADIGTCTGPYTLTRQDAQARPSAIAEPLSVTLQGTSADFYTDAGCASAPSTSLLLASGTSSATFYLRGRALGPLSVTATSAKLGNTTGSVLVGIGPAATLAFTTPPRTLPAGTCSDVLTLERRDATGLIATEDPDLDITLFLSPPVNDLQLYSDATCATPVSSVRIPQGQSSTSFRYKGTQAGTFTLTTSSTLPAVQQDLTVSLGASVGVTFTQPAQTLLTGTCSSVVEVSAQDTYGNPVRTNAQVTLSATPAVTFYSDANCQNTFSTPQNLNQSTGQLRFYFKASTPGLTTFTASTQSLGQAQQDHTVRPQANTGQCQLSATGTGSTLVECPISPPLINKDRAFLVFQAASAGDTPGNAFVRCYLADAARVVCDRNSEGPVVDIQWQTAEFSPATGVQVRHLLSEACGGTTTSVTFDPPVQNLGESFVLSSFNHDGFNVDSNDAFTVKLAAANQVDITSDGGCSVPKRALQVVEFPGAKVDRGTATIATGNFSGSVGSLPTNVDVNRTVLLHTYRSPAGDALICNRLLRGEITGNNSVRFTRGDGAGSCNDVGIAEVVWERVQFPSGYSVQEKDVNINDGQASGKVGITTVAPSRTIVFSGGQNFSGQGSGETNFAANDIVGAGVGRHRLITSGTELEVVRGHAVGTALFTSYVLQLP